MPTDFESGVMRKVAWRLVPFLSFAYLINALDRFNISMAALTMNKALGLSATTYGLGAGAFFWSYVLFQMPANAMLVRFGPRRWIGFVIAFWGVCSTGTAFVTGETSFVIVRFLLGVAESGFFPGVAYFLTRWFPALYRGRAMGVFYAFAAAAGIIGGPLSAGLLMLDGWLGIAGWQWIFLVEGVPAIILAVFCTMIIDDRPSEARFLNAEERGWLDSTLESERAQATGKNLSFLRALATPTIAILTLVYLLIAMGIYGQAFFLPLMIKGLGFSNTMVGYVSAVPAIFGAAGMILVARSSDRTGERMWHVMVPLLIGGAGLILAGFTLTMNAWLVIAAFSLASFGMLGSLPVFWSLPTAFLSATAAASGIAFINSVGNISGYAAPQFVGIVHDTTGSYQLPMLVMGMIVLIGGLLVPVAVRRQFRQVPVTADGFIPE